MAKYKHPLSSVKIASPCSADWEDMIGNDRSRFCGRCDLNVYNLSDMTKREAEHLINQTEGRLCVRFYRRTDGTILTRDCPVGLQAMKRRLSRIRNAVVSSVLSFLAGLGVYSTVHETAEPHLMGVMAAPEKLVGSNSPSRDIEPLAKAGGMAPLPRNPTSTIKKKRD
jgi:hypothetical protein